MHSLTQLKKDLLHCHTRGKLTIQIHLPFIFNVFHITRNLRDAPVNHFKTDFEFAPSSSLIQKDDVFIDTTEERPPALLSYTWEVCDPNTFTCTDSTISPREL